MSFNRKPNMNLIKPDSPEDRYLAKQLGSRLFTYQKVLSMLLPLILDQFFITTISLLSTAMISASSQESVTAVSLINPLAMMIYAIFSAISVGGTVIVAQYKGRGDDEKLRDTAGQIILATSFVALVSCILIIIGSGPLVRWLFGSASPEVLGKAVEYLIGVAVSQVFLAVYMSAFAVFRGIGASNICLRLTIVINVIYLLSSLLFINLLGLDILGTALSLNIARFVGCVVAILLLMYPKSILRIYPRHIFRIDLSILKSMMKLSLPFALEQIFFNGGSMLAQTYLVTLGTVSVAANAIAFSAFNIIYSAGLAVSTLATTIIGQCVGAGDKKLTRSYSIKLLRLGTVATIISILILLPMMPLILKLYHAPKETLSLIYSLLIIAVIPMPFFWSASNILPNILRSAGDSLFSSVVSLITMWTIRIGLGYVLSIRMGIGVQGVWICMGIEWAVRTLVFLTRYRSEEWLAKKTIE